MKEARWIGSDFLADGRSWVELEVLLGREKKLSWIGSDCLSLEMLSHG